MTDQIGQLVRLAGRRPMPDHAQMARARAAAHAEWSQLLRRGQRGSMWWWLACATAAASAAAVAVWLWTRPQPTLVPAPDVARIERITAPILVSWPGQPGRSIAAAGVIVKAGERIETPETGRAVLSLAGEMSIRLDRNTTAVLRDEATLMLERGAVYVDTGAGYRGTGLQVITPIGSVRHLGTQFEVRLEGGEVRVRVREGRIAFEDRGREWTSRAGESLLFVRGREPVRQVITTSGQDWNWVTEIARPFRLEGSTVGSFLDWIGRETGWRWEYADPALGERISRIVLHGSIDGLFPDEALSAVLPTCGLTSSRKGDRLIISAVSARSGGR